MSIMVMSQSIYTPRFVVPGMIVLDVEEPPTVYMIWEGDDGIRSGLGHKGERLIISVLGKAWEWLPAWWTAI